MSLPSDPSQLRKAINDTLLTMAEDKRFDSLARDSGYPRPFYIERSGWRRGCLAAVYGKGATFGCFFAFLEGVLSQYAVSFTGSISPSNPQRLTASAATFGTQHAGRLVRIPGIGLFRIETYTSSTVVELLPFATGYWDKADWTDLDATTIEGCEILAFEVHEPTPTLEETGVTVATTGITPASPSLARVYIHNDVISPTPPTYIQPNAGARPVGEPLGGHIQTDAAEVGDQTDGPFPLYLVGTKVMPEVVAVMKRRLIAAGYQLEFRRSPLG